jgi:hypothetical protein
MTIREDVRTRITPEIDARRRTETPRSRTSAFLAVVRGRGGAHAIGAATNSIPHVTARNINAVGFSSHARRRRVLNRAMALTKMR